MILAPAKELFSEIVDYAGLFPPAKLPLDSVIKSYDEYRASPQHWMLGRLVLPHGLLEEFEQLADRRLPRSEVGQPWKISCLVPSPDSPDWDTILRKVVRFNERHSTDQDGRVRVEMVETRADEASQLPPLVKSVDKRIDFYVELPYQEDPAPLVRALADIGSDRVRAKIRTGGVTPELIPSGHQVQRFITECITAKLAFKATAGLHHPTRESYALTYNPQPECAVMHGFLNVFMAAGLIMQARASQTEISEVLSETDPRQFHIDEFGCSWRGLTLDAHELQTLRTTGLVSFGSCSFVEPVEELEAMGISLE